MKNILKLKKLNIKKINLLLNTIINSFIKERERERERERNRERASMAKCLERAFSVPQMSGSFPRRDGHKNLCGCRELLASVSGRAVKRQRFRTLKQIKQNQEQHFLIVPEHDVTGS